MQLSSNYKLASINKEYSKTVQSKPNSTMQRATFNFVYVDSIR